MAVAINKNRMLMSRVLMILILLVSFITAPAVAVNSAPYYLMKALGFILLIFCAIGRIYSTVFIGGVKNKNLMREGPYSACRNPLYLYSLMGAAGMGLVSTHISYFLILFFGFLFIYRGLIKREEEFLSEKFGDSFAQYKKEVPRLLPKCSALKYPEEMLFQPRYLNNAIKDAIWWFVPLPFYELIEYLHSSGIIDPLMRVW